MFVFYQEKWNKSEIFNDCPLTRDMKKRERPTLKSNVLGIYCLQLRLETLILQATNLKRARAGWRHGDSSQVTSLCTVERKEAHVHVKLLFREPDLWSIKSLTSALTEKYFSNRDPMHHHYVILLKGDANWNGTFHIHKADALPLPSLCWTLSSG